MNKKYDNSSSLHEKILTGVNKLTDNVASTLGPKGKNVILQEKGKMPIITKDGVTIANFVSLEDEFENAAAQIVKQAASKTNEEAGDGTTTSTVLTRAVLEEAQKYLISGVSPVELKRGMDKATKQIVDFLVENSTAIASKEDIENIATISANGDKKIGALIAEAIDQAGKDGAVSIEDARSSETSLDLIEGFTFDSGYVSPQFINDERKAAVRYENCLIFVTDHKLDSLDSILPVLETAARESRPFIIVADDVEGQLLAALIMNSIRGSMKVAAVKAPRYGEERRAILADLALATGAHFITRQSGMSFKDVKLKHLGYAKKVEILKKKTIIAGGRADHEKVGEQIEVLKEKIKQEDSIEICERIQERITRLASGVAVIRVGAATQIEMVEKRHRIEDALEAVRAAQLNGIHAGGGVSLLKAAAQVEAPEMSEEQLLGFKIVLRACEEPIRQMAENAAESADIVINSLKEKDYGCGFNFMTGEHVDMLEEGIIDPVRVTCCALQNAISVASTLITTNYAIINTA